MRRPSALHAVVLTLLVVGAGLAIGQPRGAAAWRAPSGPPIPLVNADGAATGTVAVAAVTDPFTDFDPSQPPEAGKHYVALTVVFDANAGKKLDVDPYSIVVQDAAGALWQPSYLPLPNSAPVPQLTRQSLGPGSRISALLGFLVPDGTKLSRVWYKSDSVHLFPLADLVVQTPPAVGQAASITDANAAVGSVTVAAVDDPFAGYDPASPPAAGTRFVLLTLVYDNPGSGRFDVEPYGLVVRDAQGRLWSQTGISRPSDTVVVPDLTSRPLAPGDRISGAIGFALPDGVALDALYWQPSATG
ncbi:MAG TPA: hypothetical protein VFU81_21830 [Thermomicrobiales bacterium]|nr:hypothetical protein [Thermomicrobiales bacterium]